MEETISIAPFGTGSGLKVFECPSCGAQTTHLEQRRRPNPPSRSSADKKRRGGGSQGLTGDRAVRRILSSSSDWNGLFKMGRLRCACGRPLSP
jgi:hypothetical protein